MTDTEYMKRALELANRGMGYVAPNPMVGAVIVKNGKIIGEGWHEKYGGLHAERNALAHCEESPEGAVMYVTLEPCCHFGKTPPCTQAIIENRIAKVVIGTRDANPLVAGKGIQQLKDAGITVIEDVQKKECEKLNEVFFYYIKTGCPYVVMKYAMTMDGKIATYTSESKWITGDAAREQVQRDRHRYAGIMVGVKTVIADNPMLTCRIKNGKNPTRIICDTHLHTPVSAQIVQTADQVKTIIVTNCKDDKKQEVYRKKGCTILLVSEKEGHINLKELMIKIGEAGIDSILLEGGATLNWSAMQAGIVNRVQTYIAPKMFGGREAQSPIEGKGVEHPQQAFGLKNSVITQIGNDILIESEVIKECLPEL